MIFKNLYQPRIMINMTLLYMRSFLFLIIMFLTVPLFLPIALFAYTLSYPRRYVVIRQWARAMLWWLRIICQLDYVVQGVENMPSSPAIVFAKHQSAWETLALQQIVPPMAWVLKRELLWVPFFGWCLAILEPIAINRSSGRKALQSLIRQGKERIAARRWIVVFPEGTRVAPGHKGRYAIGGAMLAEHTAVPVVPIAHNAGEYWSRRSFLKFPGTIQVVIGPPIPTSGRRADQINADAERWIEETMKKISRHSQEDSHQSSNESINAAI
ncbi:1-acyl-sn-glycerol-3-phosphate acyltransferase [Gammaproteobacteria bacterium]